MSQRNPLNERYQNTDERTGKTRKSAASAKPTTKAAASVRMETKREEPKGLFARARSKANKSANASGKGKAAQERRREQEMRAKYYNVDTPEYKKWRKIWWGMLIGAIACTAISFFISSQESLVQFTYVFIILSYVLLISAIVLDFTHIRKLRNEYVEAKIAEEKSKKNSAKRKEAAAEARKAAQEAEANEEAGAAEEDRKPFRGLFARKRASDAVATAKSAQARAAAEADDASGKASDDAGGAKTASGQ